MTIKNLKDDGEELEKQILGLCKNFEIKWGEGTIYSVFLARYNGSNWSSGPIVNVNCDIVFDNIIV